MEPKIFEKHIVVKKEDIDFNGHVNNLKYLEWMINIAMEHSTHEGFGVDYYKKHGVSWVARKHCIEYRLPAFEGDELILKTWIDEVKKLLVIRKYEIYKNDKLITSGFSEWVFVDFKTQRPKKIPEDIIKKFIIE
ncbi:acyl-CoA thioesterase [Nautilia sp. PV-1]|uniref:acyl-CoA thioesterase n=1 Tax=Nautilia sp. PV-1 TaxID=2579250 RepID=UPI000FDCB756|nr:thioesterase family protein [Nautilia sp. PV-1]AZV46433.1 acyl-CoA thioesterase [Nautilia sp. PV-1]